MNARRILALVLSAALASSMLAAPAAAAGESLDSQRYVFQLKEAAVMPLSAPEGIQPVPYAPGYYTAESMEDLRPYLEAGVVEFAAPDGTLELLTEEGGSQEPYPNDPGAGEQWYLESLGMDAVWASELDGSGITVAVIDSGLVREHEDLQYETVAGYNFLGAQGYEDTADWGDTTGHGSLAGGLLAAQTHNGLGVAGLADGVKLLALRCFADSSNGTTTAGSGSVSTIISAIHYAIEQEADVINMSFGGTNAENLAPLQEPLEAAVEAGIILVAAVGNDGNATIRYPAGFDCVIGVGGVAEDGALYANSNRNDSVFVTAPAVDIYGLGYREDEPYRSDTGTSMAAPMVSALAALAKQADRAIDNEGFRALLQESVTDLGEEGYDTSYGWGSVSAEKFVQALQAPRSIVYDCSGGALPEEEGTPWSTTYQIGGGADVTLPVPTREGYAFTGWYLDGACTGEPVDGVPGGSVGTVTLYAGWQEESTEPDGPEPPGVADGAASQEGAAVPPSLDGLTGAQPYTAAVSPWFTGAVAYEISGEPSLGTATITEDLLTYLPPVEAAGQRVTFTLRGTNGELESGDVTVSVEVGPLPVSDSTLAEDSAAYDLYTQSGGVTVGLDLYGNGLSGILSGERSLELGTEYLWEEAAGAVTLSHSFLTGLGTGEHPLVFLFDNGRTEESRQALFTVTVRDSTPETPSGPETGGGTGGDTGGGTGGDTGGGAGGFPGGGIAGGGSAPAPMPQPETPDLELLETEDAVFYYSLTDGAAAISFDPEELERLAGLETLRLDLSGVAGVTSISLSGGDLKALQGCALELVMPAGAVGFASVGTEDLTVSLLQRGDGYAFSVTGGDGGLTPAARISLPIPLGEGESPVGLRAVLLGEDGSRTALSSRWDPLSGALRLSTDRTGRILITREAWNNPFEDLSAGDWFYQAVEYVSDIGLMDGVGGKRFDPQGALSRAMLVTVLWRLAGEPGAAEAEAFADVDAGSWYGRAVAWAAEKAVVAGYGDGLFRPDQAVTRQEMAVILHRFARTVGQDTAGERGDLTAFADYDQMGQWALEGLEWAVGTGLLQGRGGGRAVPQGTATRAEAAMILMRFCSL